MNRPLPSVVSCSTGAGAQVPPGDVHAASLPFLPAHEMPPPWGKGVATKNEARDRQRGVRLPAPQ